MSSTVLRILSLAAAVFLLAQSAAVRALVECRMSGRLQTTCCCHGGEAADSASSEKRIERTGCCRITALKSGATPASPTDGFELPLSAPGVLVVLDDEPLQMHRSCARAIAARSRAPPNGWPPLFIKHRSLLS